MLEIPRNVVSVILVPPRLWQRRWLCKIVWYIQGFRCSSTATGKTPMAAFDLGVQEVHRCIASWEAKLGDNLVDADIYREDDDDDDDDDDDVAADDSRAAWRSGSPLKDEHPDWPNPNDFLHLENGQVTPRRPFHLIDYHPGPPASLN
jgi:hypothetical protein